jgi:Helix-turn-helix domain/Glucodextranase, domain B
MAIFCFKPLTTTRRLSHIFSEARLKQEISIQQLSARTRIPEKYLLALEAGTPLLLPPAKAFRLAYVRSVAEALNLSVDKCLNQFRAEGGLNDLKTSHPQTQLRSLPFTSIGIFARNLFLGSLVLLFIGYLSWQIKGILQPPTLNVFYPEEGAIINDLSTAIAGQTENESRVSINGQSVMLNNQGRFSINIDLTPGLNTVTVAAVRKHGKTTLITRHLIVRPKTNLGLQRANEVADQGLAN